MIQLATTRDRSTYVVTATFTDQDDAALTPTAITWSLFDGKGAVVNSRNDVSVTPASSIQIVLTGADLAYSTGSDDTRVIVVEATYSATIGGTLYPALTLKDSAKFLVSDLQGV